LFAQTWTGLFKSTTFEASGGDFQDTPLFRKGKCSMLLGPSNAVINEKIPMPAVSNNMRVEAALPAPIPSTGCTSDCITTSKKHKRKTDKT
jgi:hypothetical protein